MHPRQNFSLRRLSQASALSASAPQSSAQPHILPQRQPYFISRNANGNLPVYSDIRNNGTRRLVHIRGVDGHVHLLAQHLRTDLFSDSSITGQRSPQVSVQLSRNIVISGSSNKNQVIEWLKAHGF